MQKTNKFFSRMPIANKITLMYCVTFVAVFLIASVFMFANATYFYMEISKGELAETAATVVEHIKSDGELDMVSLRELRNNRYVDIIVLDISGEPVIFGTTFREAVTIQELRGETPSFAVPARPIANFKINAFRGNRSMFYEERLEHNGHKYSVQVMRRYSYEQQVLSLIGTVFVIANILGILSTVLIGRYLNRRLLKPIVTVSQTAERISIEDLTQRIPLSGPNDEIRKLSETFNDMLERLEGSFNAQTRFVSAASHELRTPISVIQGYANLIDRWGKQDPSVLQESIDSIKSETQRMTHLIEKLLFLAKGQQVKVQKTEQNLNQLIAEIKKEMQVMEVAAEVTITEECNATVRIDYDLIKQMLWIFIENSLKYSDSGLKIEFKIFRTENGCCLSVADNGIGIRQEDLPHIFERFYRADKSRNSEVSGTGLGLSVAEWIIKQHNAKATVTSVLGAGTEITVSFPTEKG